MRPLERRGACQHRTALCSRGQRPEDVRDAVGDLRGEQPPVPVRGAPRLGGGGVNEYAGARRVERGRAQSIAPTMPASVSPEPAVASAAHVEGFTTTRPDGSATSVCSPLSTTTAFARDASVRTAANRSASTASDVVPRRRAASPACGVSTAGTAARAKSSGAPAASVSASAS